MIEIVINPPNCCSEAGSLLTPNVLTMACFHPKECKNKHLTLFYYFPDFLEENTIVF